MKSRSLIILGGVGRSGTSITGTLLSTTDNTASFYEPAVPYYLMERINEFGDLEIWRTIFKVSVYYDLLSGALAGRNLNLNPFDDSSALKYMPKEEIDHLHSKSFRQFEIFEKAKSTNILLKLLENIHNFGLVSNVLEDVMGVVVIRNPVDTINSLLKKGWFSDEQLHISSPEPGWVMNIKGEWRIHPFLKGDDEIEEWLGMSEVERASHYYKWHLSKFLDISSLENLIIFSYDQLVKQPVESNNILLEALGLKSGKLTQEILESIKPSKATEEDYLQPVSKQNQDEMQNIFQRLQSVSINYSVSVV